MLFVSRRAQAYAAGCAVGVVFISASTGAVAATMITGAQIKDGTVATVDIKDGILQLKDFASPPVQSDNRRAPSQYPGAARPTCPSGWKLAGGGFQSMPDDFFSSFGSSDEYKLVASYPSGRTWRVKFERKSYNSNSNSTSAYNVQVPVSAICTR